MSPRTFHHLTPRYVLDRTQLMLYERSHPHSPWLTPHAVEFLDQWLRPTDQGLEWGSGRSTLWFADRIDHLTSIEHNPDWAQKVSHNLAAADLAHRVDFHLCPDAPQESPDTQYVRLIDNLPDASLDFCLIDGLARDHCALACLPKLKPAALLIIDNINWYLPKDPKSPSPNSRSLADGPASESWQHLQHLLNPWRSFWTSCGVTDTAFWFKPPTP